MKVKDLIKILIEKPLDAEVIYWYDSGPRGGVDDVVINKSGKAILFDNYQPSEKEEILES